MDRKPLIPGVPASSTEELLGSIIENIPNMIFLKEARELRFVRFNQAGEELLGYSRDELIGKNDYDFFPKDEADFFVSRDRAVLASGQVLDIQEEPIHTRYKGKRILHTKKLPLMGPDGQPAYLLGISEDITDRKRIEQAEAELYRSRNLEGIGRLAGSVAHDFNNLLTGILGIITELRHAPDMPVSHQEELDMIIRSGQRASGLTRQLLAFGRREMATPQVLRINDIIGELQPLLQRLITPEIKFDFHLATDLHSCRIDPGQMEQVLLNVLLNARDSMPEGGRIEVRTANRSLSAKEIINCPELASGDYVEVAVKDTGVGMDEETRQRAFEPFYSTKPKDKGSGLGLSTAYGIVKQNAGDISLASAPGRGTVVTLWLPQAVLPKPSPAPSTPVEAPKGNESILVAEDDPLVRRTVVRTLERAGYRVVSATNGNEALEAGLAQPFDLLLTDILMPGMNGRHLAAALAKSRPQLRVIYMSGYAEDIVALREILHADIAFLEKVFSSDMLLTKVREVLDATHTPAIL